MQSKWSQTISWRLCLKSFSVTKFWTNPNKKSLRRIYGLIVKWKLETAKQKLKVANVKHRGNEGCEGSGKKWRKPSKAWFNIFSKDLQKLLNPVLTRLSQENQKFLNGFLLFIQRRSKKSRLMKKCDSEPGRKNTCFHTNSKSNYGKTRDEQKTSPLTSVKCRVSRGRERGEALESVFTMYWTFNPNIEHDMWMGNGNRLTSHKAINLPWIGLFCVMCQQRLESQWDSRRKEQTRGSLWC